jgi:3-hydroxybutyryl-CoA dehydrogenase
MKILVIGEVSHFEECSQKLGVHDYSHVTVHAEGEKLLVQHDIIFDFLIGDRSQAFEIYSGKPVTAFLNTCKITLADLARAVQPPLQCTIFGFNGFPTLFNREFLEVSVLTADDTPVLKKFCQKLSTDFLLVDDRVGLVTPRVICMIVNEAYYTLQEGTATRQDIDLAMKLGTNYPYGPFEWCDRIGLKDVYELLDAVYKDTKDERYKISALMKKEYLRLRASP